MHLAGERMAAGRRRVVELVRLRHPADGRLAEAAAAAAVVQRAGRPVAHLRAQVLVGGLHAATALSDLPRWMRRRCEQTD